VNAGTFTATGEQYEYIAESDRQMDERPTRAITAGGVEFAYRELGANNPGTPVVFLIHLAAILDNWDPRVVDGLATSHHVIAAGIVSRMARGFGA
jgi:hypothetical protein